MNGEESVAERNRRDAAVVFGKTIGKGIVVLAAGILLGTLLLTLAYMIPVNPENKVVSYQIIEKEGSYPRITVVSPGQYFESFYPDVLDNFTDRIMLSTALDSTEGNPLVRAMESYSDYIGSYNHYWHGYVAILRPLLFVLDFSDLRTLNGAFQLLIVALLIWVIGREKGIRYVLSFLTSYLLLNPRTVAMGLQYTWIFYIAYGGTLVLLSKRDFFAQKNRLLYFFIVLGMFTCYLDMLTYPLLTWGFPLVWWIVTEKGERKVLDWVKCVVCSGIAWIVGYAGIWAAKWWIATLVLKKDVFATAMKEIFYCSGTAETKADNLAARWNAIYVNWRHYAYKIYMVILVGWLLWWIVYSLRKRWNKSSKSYALFLIGISSIVWYIVLSSHTTIHHFFTHRIYGVSIAAFLAILLESVREVKREDKLSGRGRAGICGLIAASVVLACFCSLFAKEGILITNGTGNFHKMRMEKALETEIVPTIDTIEKIYLGLECNSLEGRYEVKLWEGDKLKYQNTFLLENRVESNYQRLTTWWVLKHGKTYRMTVEAIGTDAPVYAWLTEEGDMPLLELGELSVDGKKTGGQFLMGLHYLDRHYVPKERQVFLILTWIGIFMAAGYTLWGTKCVRDEKRELR